MFIYVEDSSFDGVNGAGFVIEYGGGEGFALLPVGADTGASEHV